MLVVHISVLKYDLRVSDEKLNRFQMTIYCSIGHAPIYLRAMALRKTNVVFPFSSTM